MASFFDEISANRIRSILLMIAFGAIFAGIEYFLIIFLGGGIFALAIGIGVIILYAAFTYFYGSKIVLKMSNAKVADKNQYGQLYDVISGLTAASQLPMPTVYIIDDPNPNAFATGKNRKSASIAVTTGLLSMMNRNELEGVLAHEVSHIANNDIQFMLYAIVFAGAIGIISALIRNIFFFGGMSGGNRDNGGIFIIIGIVVGLLAPIFALLLRLAISRKREYMADANGARIIRAPSHLASALKKIESYEKKPNAQPVRHVNEITSSLYFENPISKASVMNLFSTHPPIEERIKRLEHMY